MKKNNILKIFIPVIIFLAVTLYGKGIETDEFIIGKLEFTGKSGKEGILVLNSPGKSYLLNKGVLLFIKRGNERVIIKVIDSEGNYIRCAADSTKGDVSIKEGEDVYYSDALNSGIKYRDAKRILVELIKLYENFILKIESTEDTVIIADALNEFSVELDKLMPEMKRINSKYPELSQFKISPPAELMDESAMLEVLEPRLKDVFFKIKMYDADEKVKKATDELQKVLTKMNSGR